jgi:hypothetical protein
LTVGANTRRTFVEEPDHQRAGWTALAPAGDLSPYSRTGVMFEGAWPIKPDVVFEGGNVVRDLAGEVDFGLASLGVLTTGLPPGRLLDVSCATSAACAQVAGIAASVIARYPQLWPEAVRGLIVHSARWTDAMEQRLPKKPKAKQRAVLHRRYGYGEPSLDRALHSARDVLTLVAQAELQPYVKGHDTQMMLHRLPWPSEALGSLGAALVRLRVTLSYFIEPNPARRGWRSRFRYSSHGLRFAVKRAEEKLPSFRRRINATAAKEGAPDTETSEKGWQLGPRQRTKGSIHSDVWTGTAASLAARDAIAVYPAGGWWADVANVDGQARRARYALIVSIEADSIATEVDIWTPVAQQIGLVQTLGR